MIAMLSNFVHAIDYQFAHIRAMYSDHDSLMSMTGFLRMKWMLVQWLAYREWSELFVMNLRGLFPHGAWRKLNLL